MELGPSGLGPHARDGLRVVQLVAAIKAEEEEFEGMRAGGSAQASV